MKRAPWIAPDTPEPYCEWCGGPIPPERRTGPPGASRGRYCSTSCWSECIDEPNWDTTPEPKEEE